MAESSTSPSSTMNTEGLQKISTPKDKCCPYCNQPFTSSSLGRHLDLYIKPQNPKPPDGIHDVEEIRKVRGGITRRQPRTSSKRDSSTPGSTAPAAPDPRPHGKESPASIMRSPSFRGPDRTGPGTTSWQATGVINDLPARKSGNTQETSDSRREGAYHRRQKIDRQQRLKTADELDSGLAAEMALKEVLWTLKDARVRTTTRTLFDFNPFEHTFPSLCLLVLDPPPTIFAPTPFPSSNSWSISPPSDAQFEALCRLIRQRSTSSKEHAAQGVGFFRPSGESGSEQYGLPCARNEDDDHDRLMRHVCDSYENWKHLSVANRAEIWQLETLRGLARAYNERRKAQRDLMAVRQDLRQSHVMSSGREGEEMSKDTPSIAAQTASSLTTSDDVTKLINILEIDDPEWSYDRLIDKWRYVARAEREARASKQRNFPPVEERSTVKDLPPHTRSGPSNESATDPGRIYDIEARNKEELARANISAKNVDAEREDYSEMDVDEKLNPSNTSTGDIPGSSLPLPVMASSNIAQSKQISFHPISPNSRQLPPISASKQVSRPYNETSALRRSESRGW